jgi:hypothetical protein
MHYIQTVSVIMYIINGAVGLGKKLTVFWSKNFCKFLQYVYLQLCLAQLYLSTREAGGTYATKVAVRQVLHVSPLSTLPLTVHTYILLILHQYSLILAIYKSLSIEMFLFF